MKCLWLFSFRHLHSTRLVIWFEALFVYLCYCWMLQIQQYFFVNILTLGRARAGKWICHPTLFLNFLKTVFHRHLPFSVAERTSLIHILTKVWLESVAVVTRYDVISPKCFFSVEKQESTKSSEGFNYVIFYMSSIKMFNFPPFFDHFSF